MRRNRYSTENTFGGLEAEGLQSGSAWIPPTRRWSKRVLLAVQVCFMLALYTSLEVGKWYNVGRLYKLSNSMSHREAAVSHPVWRRLASCNDRHVGDLSNNDECILNGELVARSETATATLPSNGAGVTAKLTLEKNADGGMAGSDVEPISVSVDGGAVAKETSLHSVEFRELGETSDNNRNHEGSQLHVNAACSVIGAAASASTCMAEDRVTSWVMQCIQDDQEKHQGEPQDRTGACASPLTNYAGHNATPSYKFGFDKKQCVLQCTHDSAVQIMPAIRGVFGFHTKCINNWIWGVNPYYSASHTSISEFASNAIRTFSSSNYSFNGGLRSLWRVLLARPASDGTVTGVPLASSAFAANKGHAILAIAIEKQSDPALRKVAKLFEESGGSVSPCYASSTALQWLVQDSVGALIFYFVLLCIPLISKVLIVYCEYKGYESQNQQSPDEMSFGGAQISGLTLPHSQSNDVWYLGMAEILSTSAVAVFALVIRMAVYVMVNKYYPLDCSDHVILYVGILMVLSLDAHQVMVILSTPRCAPSGIHYTVMVLIGMMVVLFSIFFVGSVCFSAFFTAVFFHHRSEINISYLLALPYIICCWLAVYLAELVRCLFGPKTNKLKDGD